MKVLLIDDHRALRQMLKSLLEPTGAVFAECESGENAAAEYARFQPDLVLMDNSMAGLHGLNAAEQMKAGFLPSVRRWPAIGRGIGRKRP